nr:zinc finger and SCAN domain-containing protein 29-like [Chrysemys picta bellii]
MGDPGSDCCMGEESVQAELRSSRRNANIYAKIAQGLVERGYTRDAQQCRVKIKALRQAYQKMKAANSCSWSEPQTCHFYDQLHAILGGNPTSSPTFSVDTCKVAVSRNTDEDFMDEEEEEENAQQASGESVLHSSQDLFLTLSQYPPKAYCSQTLMAEKAPLLQMFLCSLHQLRP